MRARIDAFLLFPYNLHGVRFDQNSLRLEHWALQVLLHLPLEMLVWCVQPADNVRKWLRARHMRHARKAEQNV